MRKTKSIKNIQLTQSLVINTIKLLRQHLAGQQDSDEYIHRIRVDIKHLRAWLRLLRIKTEAQDWKKIDKRLFELAKQLGSLRDTQAINKTIIVLRGYARTKEERAAIDHAQKQLCMEPIMSTIDWEKFKSQLSEELSIFEQEFVPFTSTFAIKNGLKRTFEKIEKFSEKTFSKQGSYDDLHKLRKWTKTLGYQLVYSNKIYSVDAKLKRGTNKLGNILGKAHDLIIIRDKLNLLSENESIEIAYSLIDRNIALIIKNSRQDYRSKLKSSAKIFMDKNNL